jgi:sugar phosphate isomerase/epimerase
MDLQAALFALDEVGYHGPLTVELYTYAELPNDGDLRAAQSAYQALKRLR